MLRTDTFWTTEKDAPLLILNKGYLQNQGDAIFSRTSNWRELAGAPSLEVKVVEAVSPDRIIVADSERTFRSAESRATFVKLLDHAHKAFGDYHQGLGYVASFLSLSLPEADVVGILRHMNYNDKFIPGYWKHETIKFATDAYVFQELALKFVPQAAQHLQKNFVDPSSYCQKWFVGLCVHVLPFEFLFQFFEGFLAGGFKYSMQFGLSLLTQLQDKILAVQNDHSKFLGLLRLDPKFIPHDEKLNELLRRTFAGTKDFNLDDINFTELREKTYDEKLKARIESAKQSFAEKDDEIEDCEICKDDFPEVYCKECKLKICENCHNKPPAGSKHSRSHKVKEIEEDEEEEEEDEGEDDDEEDEKPNKKTDDAVDKATAGLEKLSVKA